MFATTPETMLTIMPSAYINMPAPVPHMYDATYQPVIDAAYQTANLGQLTYDTQSRVQSAGAKFCHSCAQEVCDTLYVEGEGCCIECLQTFPQSPHTSPTALPDQSPTPHAASQYNFMLPPPGQLCTHTWSPTPMPLKNDLLLASTPSKRHVECLKDQTDASTEYSGTESTTDPHTTMMITNIPCRYGQEAIEKAIDAVGFGGLYDFVYIPRRRSTHEGNIGYAFVNFFNSEDADRFVNAFEGYQFPGSKSLKKCTVKVAHQQGFDALMAAQNQAATAAASQQCWV